MNIVSYCLLLFFMKLFSSNNLRCFAISLNKLKIFCVFFGSLFISNFKEVYGFKYNNLYNSFFVNVIFESGKQIDSLILK